MNRKQASDTQRTSEDKPSQRDDLYSVRQAIKGRLTDSEEPVIIGVKGRGLVCIPKGSTLPNGRKQPISQALFRVEGGVALILNKHSKQEHVFAIVDWDEDQSGQKFITLKIPIEGFYRNQLN